MHHFWRSTTASLLHLKRRHDISDRRARNELKETDVVNVLVSADTMYSISGCLSDRIKSMGCSFDNRYQLDIDLSFKIRG